MTGISAVSIKVIARCYDASEVAINDDSARQVKFGTNDLVGNNRVFDVLRFRCRSTRSVDRLVVNGKTVKDADELSIYLLEEAHVATVGGDSFGDTKSIRISYAAAEDNLIEAMKRIKNALGKLK